MYETSKKTTKKKKNNRFGKNDTSSWLTLFESLSPGHFVAQIEATNWKYVKFSALSCANH